MSGHPALRYIDNVIKECDSEKDQKLNNFIIVSDHIILKLKHTCIMDNKKKKELKNYQAGIQYFNKEYILMV